MSNSVSTADPAPAAGKEAPAPLDGWRSGGLPALRAELDRIDNAVHDLLMQRAEVVSQVARSGKPAAFRPGREASIIRRLLARHHGALPPVTLVRIWRELLAGTTSMQGGFALAVYDGDHATQVTGDHATQVTGDHATQVTQLAREHFGALTPLHVYPSSVQALVDVSHGLAPIAVLPYPSESDPWWVTLMHHQPRLHIIARLPFWQARPEGAPTGQALVVATTPADASGQDRSFVGFECDGDVSRNRLAGELSATGLNPLGLTLVRQQGLPRTNILVKVEGIVMDDDPRLLNMGAVLRQPVVLGSYAVPVAGERR